MAMNDPWFDPKLAWLPGTVLGCFIGLWGGVVGLLASRGRAKPWVFASLALVIVASATLLIFGITAYAQNQPRHVWYGLGYPGLLCFTLSVVFIPVLLTRYHHVEKRRLELDEIAHLRAQVKELTERSSGVE